MNETENYIKIRLPVAGQEISAELVWAVAIPDVEGQARIANCPAFAQEFALGDIVAFDTETGNVNKIVRKVGWSCLVEYKKFEEGEDGLNAEDALIKTKCNYAYLKGHLQALGCQVEGQLAGVAAVTVPAGWGILTLIHALAPEIGRVVAFSGPGEDRPMTMLSDVNDELLEKHATAEDINEELKHNNFDRASRAYGAMEQYWAEDGDEELETTVGDLLGDLQHLCRLTDTDFDRALQRGRMHHDEERDGIY